MVIGIYTMGNFSAHTSQIQGRPITLSNLNNPAGCTFTPSGDEFVVMNYFNNTAYRYAYNTITKEFTTIGTQINLSNLIGPGGGVFSPSGNQFVVVNRGNSTAYCYAYDKINKIFSSTGTQINLANLNGPRGCMFTPSGEFIVLNANSTVYCFSLLLPPTASISPSGSIVAENGSLALGKLAGSGIKILDAQGNVIVTRLVDDTVTANANLNLSPGSYNLTFLTYDASGNLSATETKEVDIFEDTQSRSNHLVGGGQSVAKVGSEVISTDSNVAPSADMTFMLSSKDISHILQKDQAMDLNILNMRPHVISSPISMQIGRDHLKASHSDGQFHFDQALPQFQKKSHDVMVWVQPFYDIYNVKTMADTGAGTHGNTFGTLLGVHKKFSSDLLWGLIVGVSKGLNDQKKYENNWGGKGSVETIHVGSYISKRFGNLGIEGFLMFGRSFFNNKRYLATAEASQKHKGFDVSVRLGMDYRFNDYVKTFLHVGGSRTFESGYTETGAGNLDITMPSMRAHHLSTELGVPLPKDSSKEMNRFLNPLSKLSWAMTIQSKHLQPHV